MTLTVRWTVVALVIDKSNLNELAFTIVLFICFQIAQEPTATDIEDYLS